MLKNKEIDEITSQLVVDFKDTFKDTRQCINGVFGEIYER